MTAKTRYRIKLAACVLAFPIFAYVGWIAGFLVAWAADYGDVGMTYSAPTRTMLVGSFLGLAIATILTARTVKAERRRLIRQRDATLNAGSDVAPLFALAVSKVASDLGARKLSTTLDVTGYFSTIIEKRGMDAFLAYLEKRFEMHDGESVILEGHRPAMTPDGQLIYFYWRGCSFDKPELQAIHPAFDRFDRVAFTYSYTGRDRQTLTSFKVSLICTL